MNTSGLNSEIDQITNAVNWAEMYPRDPDSWADLRRKLRDLRQFVDTIEAEWRQSNQASPPSPLPWSSQSSSEWSLDTLAPVSEPSFLSTKNVSPDAKP